MIKVEIVCNSTLQIEKAKEIRDKSGGENAPTFIIYNMNDAKEIYNAKKVMHHWAARKCPFAVVSNDNNPLIGFWSEACDVFDDLVKYLDNGELRDILL